MEGKKLNTKKHRILAMLLALVMVLSTPLSVFAEGDVPAPESIVQEETAPEAGEEAEAPAEEAAPEEISEEIPEEESQAVSGITAQPQDAEAYANDEAVFTVGTSGEVKSYQWQFSKNGSTWYNYSGLYGGRSDTLTVKAGSYSKYAYRCEVSFADGSSEISETAKVVILASSIKEDPKDLTVERGKQAAFSVAINGTIASVQWQVSYNNGRRWTNLSQWIYGSAETLRFTAGKEDNGALIRAVVSTKDGKRLTSAPAKLTVVKKLAFPAMKDAVALGNTKVAVDAPAEALPEGTVLEVEEVATKEVREQVESVVDGTITDMLVFDISFSSGEPQKEVSVSITAEEIAANAGKDFTLVHIKDNGEVEIIENAVIEGDTLRFSSDEFSTYSLVWTEEAEKSATIHWGYIDGETFTEFTDTASLDSDAGSMNLNLIFDGYMYSTAHYENGEDEYALDSPILTKVTAEDGSTSWTMTAHVTTGEDGSPETVTIEDGTDIYVVYVEKTAGYTPPAPSPANVKGPITEKHVSSNGDGTYKIRLDITGQQDHTVNRIGANVIIVMDRTESMNTSMPDGGTRMAAAKTALTTLIETLNPGTGENQNLINFTAVDFANSASYVNGINWTTTRSQMQGYVDDLSYWGFGHRPDGFGTCWQAGLYGGIVRANAAANDENLNKNKTYIIFVTDGNPNGWYTRTNSDGGPANRPNYQQSGQGTFVEAAYTAAIPNAINASIACDYHLYGIFCGSTTDMVHLQDLMNYNGTQGQVKGTFIDGTSASAINNAFKTIAQTIVKDLGASEVVVDDGVPTLTNVSAAVSGSAGGFNYYIKPKDGEETVWENAPSAGYSSSNGVTWDLSSAGVLADGTVYSLEFDVWPTQAAYDLLANLNNKMPGWTLDALDDATREQLVVTVDGTQYGYTSGSTANTGTWAPQGGSPSYTTAQLLTRIAAASSVDYSVLTNTHLSTTYKYGETTYCDPPASGLVTEAMLLESSYFGIHKVWNNGIDTRTANALTKKDEDGKTYIIDADGNYILDGGNKIEYDRNHPDSRTVYYVDLIVTEIEGETTTDYLEVRLYSEEHDGNAVWNWNRTYIAPGVLTHDTTAQSGSLNILESGRDYSVREKPGDSYYWNLHAETYHPMVINGEAWVLQLVTENAPSVPKDSFDGDYYNIDGEVFKKLGTADDALITAVNDRRSLLYVTKEVDEADAPADAVFAMKVTLDNAKGKYPGDEGYDTWYDTFWFAVQEDPKDRDTVIKNGVTVEGATAEEGNTGFYWIDNGGTVTVYIKAGQYICFTNLPIGTEYSVEELSGNKMPEGFVLESASPDAVPNTVAGVTYDPTPGEVDEENDALVTGVIDESNSDYSVTYDNKYLGYFYVYHSSDCSVERIYLTDARVKNEKFNMANETKGASLYGGYYKAYGKAGENVTLEALEALTFAKDTAGVATVYDGTHTGGLWAATEGGEAYEGDKTSWTSPETENGLAMTPHKNDIFFLKEVPAAKFLQPYLHYTYYLDTKEIPNAWLISDTDDLNYTSTGFVIISTDRAALFVDSLTVTTTSGGSAIKLTPKRVFGKKGVTQGYLTYRPVIDTFANRQELNDNDTVLQYWVTCDGVRVTGTASRTYAGLAKQDTIEAASETTVASTIKAS